MSNELYTIWPEWLYNLAKPLIGAAATQVCRSVGNADGCENDDL